MLWVLFMILGIGMMIFGLIICHHWGYGDKMTDEQLRATFILIFGGILLVVIGGVMYDFFGPFSFGFNTV